MNDEIWMPVVGNNDYEVSSLGRVRSLERVVGGRLRRERVLKQYRNGKHGYVGVSIGGKSVKTHRLVCCAFLGYRDSSWHVNHKNGIRDDNRLCNLEWCTAGENVRHSFSVLGKKEQWRSSWQSWRYEPQLKNSCRHEPINWRGQDIWQCRRSRSRTWNRIRVSAALLQRNVQAQCRVVV